MGVTQDFSIPIYGTAKGYHQYVFNADERLLKRYQDVEIALADLKYTIDVYKEDSFVELSMSMEGHASAACATCLEPLSLPLALRHTLHVKYGEGVNDDECIYVDKEASRLDLADALYEMAQLAMPMVWRTSEDDPRHEEVDHECSEAMIRYLVIEEEEEEESETPSVWDDLRNKLKE